MLPRTIRGRLAVLVAAVVLPATALAAILISEAQRSEQVLTERGLASTSKALSLVVDRQLGQAEAVAQALAASRLLSGGDYAGFHARSVLAVRNPDHWVALVRTSDRQQLVNTALPYGTPLPRVAVPAEYTRALAAGQTFVSDLFEGPAVHGYVVAVTVPVRDTSGVAYELSYVMRPSSLNAILDAQEVPDGWVAAVIDRAGVVVARNRRPADFVGKPSTPDMRARVRAGLSGLTESTSLEGVRTVASYSRSPTYGWTVILGAPTGEVYGSLGRLALTALVVSLLLVATGVAAAAWAARDILASTGALTRAAAAVGNPSEPGPVSTGLRETDAVAEALRAAALRLQGREDDLRRLNETLEERVAQRTHALADANRALEVRNRELQDFAHVASHDLQEPLRKVESFGDLLREDYGERLGEDGRHYLARMQAATDRMRHLIRDLLAFSRVATDTQATAPVDLDCVLQAVRSDLELRLAQTAGRIEATGLGVVHADPTQMHQLLLNLVGNALKFHRPGVPPVVRVAVERADDGVRLVVADNGVGFEPKYAEQVFGPFQRLHSRSAYEGTGMGLAIVRRIAERHGGTVTAEGTPGEGARFTVTLPGRPEGAPPPDAA